MIGKLAVEVSFPEGFTDRITDLISGRLGDFISVLSENLGVRLIAGSRLKTTGGAEYPIIARWFLPENLDAEVVAAFRAAGRQLHEGLSFVHTNSSSIPNESAPESEAPSRRKIVLRGVSSVDANGDEFVVTCSSVEEAQG